MKIALIHKDPEFKKRFALNHLGYCEINLFDTRLYPDEIIKILTNNGGVDLAIVSDNSTLVLDYIANIRFTYPNSKIALARSSSTPLNSSFRPSNFEAGFCGANTVLYESHFLNNLEEVLKNFT